MKYKNRYGYEYRVQTRLFRWLGCYWVAIRTFALYFRVKIVSEISVLTEREDVCVYTECMYEYVLNFYLITKYV